MKVKISDILVRKFSGYQELYYVTDIDDRGNAGIKKLYKNDKNKYFLKETDPTWYPLHLLTMINFKHAPKNFQDDVIVQMVSDKV